MAVTSRFSRIEYTAAGDSFIASASDISSQYTKNMFTVATPNAEPNSAALISFPALSAWSAGVTDEFDRGIYKREFSGKGWKVSGEYLYSFDSSGNQTQVGSVGNGGLVSMVDDGNVLLIVSGSAMYSCNGSTLSTLSLSFTPVQVDYLNSQFFALDTNGLVWVADVGTTTFTASNTYSAESSPDDLVAIKVFDQLILNIGKKTIEPWENTGEGAPPVARVNNAIIESSGVLNRDCITNTDSAVYLLDSDKKPYRVVSFQSQSLTDSNFGIAELFRGYDSSGAYLQSFRWDGQNIILYVFPSQGEAWGFSESTNLWFRLDHAANGQLWLGKTIAYLFGKVLVGDKTNGNIYELSSSVYQNNGEVMVRERVFRPISNQRKQLQLRKICFYVETGVGLGDDDPQMMVSISTDAGRTYSNEVWLSLGQNGDYQSSVEFYRNIKFKDLVLKVRYTGNTRFSLLTSYLEAREAGR